MRKFFLGLVAFMGISTVLWGVELWKSKPVREWSREQTQQFLNNSPWVREISVGGSMVGLDSPDLSGTGTRPDLAAGGPSGETGPAAGGASIAGGSARGAFGATSYYIEWTSAKIVRAVTSHFNALFAGAKEAETEPPPLPIFVLVVRGRDMKAFDGITNAQLKAATYLRPKRAKTKVAPSQATILKLPNNNIGAVEFHFPREMSGQPVISDQEKSVEFSCKVKENTLKTSFDLNKMTTQQGRDF